MKNQKYHQQLSKIEVFRVSKNVSPCRELCKSWFKIAFVKNDLLMALWFEKHDKHNAVLVQRCTLFRNAYLGCPISPRGLTELSGANGGQGLRTRNRRHKTPQSAFVRGINILCCCFYLFAICSFLFLYIYHGPVGPCYVVGRQAWVNGVPFSSPFRLWYPSEAKDSKIVYVKLRL